MDATTTAVLSGIGSTTGSIFSGIFPIFYLIMGFFVVILIIGILINLFVYISKKL